MSLSEAKLISFKKFIKNEIDQFGDSNNAYIYT